ncbi:aminotransferase class I/II-fold pyridoxal phosphate-dependent enzyme [Apilactobacillus kunkeei]|uniref:aminotransferase class I/II-fold pyridoxal phosphate-dependent enzyme n=1 Tax=Apilactobacillus kunkeei TaxID=148814 RepID=UPI00200A7519|nr:aminotransferase class I/II-fold pyridoxal phosphate-dependent enzyme [Apilactobacillus kunkeei]MCK8620065.1 aminotransferase class I/II-fold pyridoxal phosphate-dependent enzyme [Apilactobacillus kunkeei]
MPRTNPQLLRTYNHRLNGVAPSGIRHFDETISKNADLIKLTLGEPDLDTPEHIKQAAIQGINDNDSHYSAQAGKVELRQAITNYLSTRWNLEYDAEEVVVTNGATQSIYSALQAIVNPGDEVIIPTPIFSLYEPIIEIFGGHVIDVDTSDTGFKLTPSLLEDALEQHPGVVAIVINDPSNPTGVSYTADEVKQLGRVIAKSPIWVLSDEIYGELTFDHDHYSLAREIPDQVLYINGLSKSHAMTGWRFGYICGPSEIMQRVKMINAYMVTCVADNVQDAALEAMTNGQEDAYESKTIYQKRRDLVLDKLDEIGVEYVMPTSTFYCFIKIDDSYGRDDYQFGLDLAEKVGLGVIPGRMFGKSGEGYIRISFAASEEKITAGLDRLNKFIQLLGK